MHLVPGSSMHMDGCGPSAAQGMVVNEHTHSLAQISSACQGRQGPTDSEGMARPGPGSRLLVKISKSERNQSTQIAGNPRGSNEITLYRKNTFI